MCLSIVSGVSVYLCVIKIYFKKYVCTKTIRIPWRINCEMMQEIKTIEFHIVESESSNGFKVMKMRKRNW